MESFLIRVDNCYFARGTILILFVIRIRIAPYTDVLLGK